MADHVVKQSVRSAEKQMRQIPQRELTDIRAKHMRQMHE